MWQHQKTTEDVKRIFLQVSHTRRPHVFSIFVIKSGALVTVPKRLQIKIHDKTAEPFILIHARKQRFICARRFCTRPLFIYSFIY